jgi:hypothetical protein
MQAARLELFVSTIANEPFEITKEDLFSRLYAMGITQATIEELEDSLWDLYKILKERSNSQCK